MSGGVEYVFVGDDFTGASDTLATLARAGRRARLFLDPPDPSALDEEGLDAVGIATELRALPAGEITDRVDRLAPLIKALSPRFVHYKVCSTFDSSPGTGSIGAAVATLRRHLDPALVAIIGGQPSLGRYCAFATLFARGPDGGVHRIDRHPVMRDHPITPMGEADLRLHLAAQGLADLRLEAFPALAGGASELAERLSGGKTVPGGVLFDVLNQHDLETIGAALRAFQADRRPVLIVGASSVAEALSGSAGRHEGPAPEEPGIRSTGRCLIVAGSRSEVTAGQVDAARRFTRIAVTASDLLDDPSIASLAGRCAAVLGSGANLLVHLAPRERYDASGVELSRRLAELVSAILDRETVAALGIAGGDTSSILVRHLGFTSLAFEQQLDAGVAICIASSLVPGRDKMRLMLKGGQVGSETIFDRFASASVG
ncbi:four-carbon acid sugar kinase family protein [Aquamicrobium sp. LC103]|uniref:four-carbon acid sugar kinase family protein n=1 Tax=Aquamicrobium sp. LC103 TaxID=1120658 RepID=UPI00063EC95A|nr:four-carbon acid sugar kinase family protein [Aquamicrobium sp. LC103]TKT76162.1 four-carbon acid sugar kinase family protein [Aquamicrobium sp. LC103]